MINEVITSNEALASMMTVALRNFHLIQDFSIKLNDEKCDNITYGLGCILSPMLNSELDSDSYECLFEIESKIVNDRYIDIIHLNDDKIDKSGSRHVFTYEEKYDEENACNTIMIFANDIIDHKTSCQVNIHQRIFANKNKNGKTEVLLEYFTTVDRCIFGYELLSNILGSFSQHEINTLTIKSVHDQFDDR